MERDFLLLRFEELEFHLSEHIPQYFPEDYLKNNGILWLNIFANNMSHIRLSSKKTWWMTPGFTQPEDIYEILAQFAMMTDHTFLELMFENKFNEDEYVQIHFVRLLSNFIIQMELLLSEVELKPTSTVLK